VSSKRLGSDYTIKIFCFLFALFLWFNVASKNTYYEKAEIPVKYFGASTGYMLSANPPDKIPVILRGNGREHILYNLQKLFVSDESYISVNLSGLSKGKNLIPLTKENVFLTTGKGISVDNFIDDSFIPIYLDRKIKKTVRVDTNCLTSLNTDKKCILTGKPFIKPEFVIVEGPEDTLKSIKEVYPDLNGKKEITLKDSILYLTIAGTSPFIKVEPNEVQANLFIEKASEKSINIPLKLKGFPKEIKSKLSTDSLKIEIRAAESVINKIKESDVKAELSYESYLEQGKNGINHPKPELKYPVNVVIVSVFPEYIKFSSDSTEN
jgi:YbbR domain-containing protein